MHRNILLKGILLCLLAVILGAFGAHALKSLVSPAQVQIFETGVRYQFMHGVALIALSLYIIQFENKIRNQKSLVWASHFFLTGAVLFSGSLYFLTLFSNSTHPIIRFLGPLTPLGGLCFILGWLCWLRVVFESKVDK